jgi:hypothetical protein
MFQNRCISGLSTAAVLKPQHSAHTTLELAVALSHYAMAAQDLDQFRNAKVLKHFPRHGDFQGSYHLRLPFAIAFTNSVPAGPAGYVERIEQVATQLERFCCYGVNAHTNDDEQDNDEDDKIFFIKYTDGDREWVNLEEYAAAPLQLPPGRHLVDCRALRAG